MTDELKPDTGRPTDRATHENIVRPGPAVAAGQHAAMAIYVTREEMHDHFANLVETINKKLETQFGAVRDLLAGNEKAVTTVLNDAAAIVKATNDAYAALNPLLPLTPQAEAPAATEATANTAAAEPTASTPQPEATASTPPSPVGSGG